MPTDSHRDSRPDLDSPFWSPAPPATPEPDRATYEASRKDELDCIRALDDKHLELLTRLKDQLHFDQEGYIWHPWDTDDGSEPDEEKPSQADLEVWTSIRVLMHAIEGYLLGCVGPSTLTDGRLIRQRLNTDAMIARLQAEEDKLIARYGPPWAE